jgi:hypothetical protein
VETLTFAIAGLLVMVAVGVYVAFWVGNFRGRAR